MIFPQLENLFLKKCECVTIDLFIVFDTNNHKLA